MSNIWYELSGSKLFGENQFNLLYITRSRYEGDWHSTAHIHQFTEIFYVISGRGQFQIENTYIEVGSDDIIIINPQVEHTEIADKENPLEYIVLGIEGGGFVLHDSSETRYAAFHCGQHGQDILYCIKEIETELREKQAYSADAAHSLMTLVLIRLLRYKRMIPQEAPQQRTNRECANIKRYIDTNYSQNITLEALCELAHLSKYYLIHSFKKVYGLSPISYLMEVRLRESRYLLTHTDYSIVQISQILGFSSHSYFSRRFQNSEGISPKAYRKNSTGRHMKTIQPVNK